MRVRVIKERAELDERVADHARVWRASREIRADEGRDNRPLEDRPHVGHGKVEAERLRAGLRALRRPRAVVHPERVDLMPHAAQQNGGGRAVHAPG